MSVTDLTLNFPYDMELQEETLKTSSTAEFPWAKGPEQFVKARPKTI